MNQLLLTQYIKDLFLSIKGTLLVFMQAVCS